MNSHLLVPCRFPRKAALLIVMLFATSGSWAIEAQTTPGAQAAALANQAAAMEADLDKDCKKVAREARPLCREQRARAAQRLRSRAARLR